MIFHCLIFGNNRRNNDVIRNKFTFLALRILSNYEMEFDLETGTKKSREGRRRRRRLLFFVLNP